MSETMQGRPSWVFAALLVASGLPAGAARSAEYAAEAYVSARADSTSNLRYFRSNDDRVSSVSLVPGFRLSNLTESDGILLTGSLGGIHNDTVSPRSRLDAFAGLTFRRSSENEGVELSASFTRDSTLAIRPADASTNGQASQLVQTGQVFAYTQRTLASLLPSYTHRIDERLTFGVTAGVQAARFQDTTIGLVDYDNLSLSPRLVFQQSERASLVVTASEAWYRPRGVPNHSESSSVSLGETVEMNERLTWNATLGGTRTQTYVGSQYQCLIPLLGAGGVPLLDGNSRPIVFAGRTQDCVELGVPVTQVASASDTTRNSVLYATGLQWRVNERNRLAFSATRQVLPSPAGTTIDNRYLQAIYSHDFSAQLSGTLSAAQTASRYTGAGVGWFEFRSLGASVHWTIDPWWSLDAGATWAQSVTSGYGGSPHANLIFMQIRRDFTRVAVSR